MLMLALMTVAETAPSAGQFLDGWLQYGVLGLLVVAFILGWIVPGWYAKQLVEENKRLSVLIEEKVLPMTATYGLTMDRASSALERAADALNERSYERRSAPAGERG